MKDRFVLNGYAYDTKAEWEEAKKEEESIRYIRAKTDLNNPETILKVYTGLVEKRTLITPVGTEFLKELRGDIVRSGKLSEDEVPGIPVTLPRKKGRRAEAFAAESESKNKVLADYYCGKLRNLRIITAVLVLVIAAMFAITVFLPNSPLHSAEQQLQDKYADWEQQLTRRESEIRQREQELGITYTPE